AGDVVQVTVGVRRLVVDGGRQHPVPERLDAGDQLDGAGGGDQVADHTLAAADRDPVGALAEHVLDRQRLDLVVDLGAGAVGVDVADLFRRQAAVLEGLPDTGDGPPALLVAVGHPEGVRRAAVAGQLGVDAGAAAAGVPQ